MKSQPGPPPAALARLEAVCRERGLSWTVQRRRLMEALVDGPPHPTADELYEAVGTRLPGLSRTTVYRVLETFARLGALRKVCHPGAATRYDLVDEDHHHLLCVECGRLLDIAAAEVGEVRLPRPPRGFRVHRASVYFEGICRSCLASGKKKKQKKKKRNRRRRDA